MFPTLRKAHTLRILPTAYMRPLTGRRGHGIPGAQSDFSDPSPAAAISCGSSAQTDTSITTDDACCAVLVWAESGKKFPGETPPRVQAFLDRVRLFPTAQKA